MSETAYSIADELSDAAIERAALRVTGVRSVEELGPYSRFMFAGCVNYADCIAKNSVLSKKFVEGWQDATGIDWAGLTAEEKAEVLATECDSHHRADVDLVADEFAQRMTECIGEASARVVARPQQA